MQWCQSMFGAELNHGHGFVMRLQDEEAVKVIGGTSYNELLSRLISMLGNEAPTATVAQSHPAAASLASPPRAPAAAAPAQPANAAAPAAAAAQSGQVNDLSTFLKSLLCAKRSADGLGVGVNMGRHFTGFCTRRQWKAVATCSRRPATSPSIGDCRHTPCKSSSGSPCALQLSGS